MRLPPPPLPSLFLSSSCLPTSPPLSATLLASCSPCWNSRSRFRSILSFLVLSLFLYLSRLLAFFYLSPSFRHSRNLHRALATLRFFHVVISFLSHSPDALPLFLSSSILSGEFLIIESRRDRKRLARTWKILTLFSPEFSQLYLICVPLATPRSFYRTR